MYEENDGIYFSNARYNGLFWLDKKSLHVSYIRDFPGEKTEGINLHRKVIRINDDYYFLPHWGTGISVWKIDTDEMLFFSSKDFLGGKWEYSSESFLLDDKIWIFPQSLDQPLIYFDVLKKEFTECGWWNEKIYELSGLKDGVMSIKSIICVNGKIYFVIVGKNYLFKMDTASGNIDMFKLDKDDDPQTIAFIDNAFWFTSWQSNDIFTWDESTFEKVKYKDSVDRKNTNEKYVCSLVKYRNEIIGLPRLGKKPFHLDKAGNWCEFDFCPNNSERVHGLDNIWINPLFYVYYVRDDEKLCLLPYSLNGYYLYDGNKWSFFELKMDMSSIPVNKILSSWINNIKGDSFYIEGKQFDVEDFIDMVTLM